MPSYAVEEPSGHRTGIRSQLIYFLCVVLGLSLFLFAGIHAAGLSLSNITALYSGVPSSTIQLKESFPKPQGSPLFTDPLVDNHSGWNLHSVPATYSVAIANGQISLECDNNKLLWELLPGERVFSNFELSVNATLSRGEANNGYGIYIRGSANANSDLAGYYRFELYGDGSYAIFKGYSDQNGVSTSTRIVDYTLNPAIHKQGKTNHILIVAQGSYMSFIVNNRFLVSLSDTSYASGSVALFVANLPQAAPGAQAQFSQFNIYAIA